MFGRVSLQVVAHRSAEQDGFLHEDLRAGVLGAPVSNNSLRGSSTLQAKLFPSTGPFAQRPGGNFVRRSHRVGLASVLGLDCLDAQR